VLTRGKLRVNTKYLAATTAKTKSKEKGKVMERLTVEDTRRKVVIKEILKGIIEIYVSDDPTPKVDLLTTVQDLGLEELRALLPDIETTH